MARKRQAWQKLITQTLGHAVGLYFLSLIMNLAIFIAGTTMPPSAAAIMIAFAHGFTVIGVLGTFSIELGTIIDVLLGLAFFIINLGDGEVTWDRRNGKSNRGQIITVVVWLLLSFLWVSLGAWTAQIAVGVLPAGFQPGNYSAASAGGAFLVQFLILLVAYHIFALQSIQNDDGFGVVMVVGFTYVPVTWVCWYLFRSTGSFILDFSVGVFSNGWDPLWWVSMAAHGAAFLGLLVLYYLVFRHDYSNDGQEEKRRRKMQTDMNRVGSVPDDDDVESGTMDTETETNDISTRNKYQTTLGGF